MAIAERELTAAAPQDDLRPLRWTRAQYHRMGEAGILDDLRVELLEGEIIEMPPIGTKHVVTVYRAAKALEAVFPPGHYVITQSPFDAGPRSEPEPDVAVYAGEVEDYEAALPKTAVLVVEVADSTLTTDRTRKAALYAEAGVPEYWIINLPERLLEVFRQPVGAAYQDHHTLMRDESVSPLAAPQASIPVQTLLPRRPAD